MEIKSQSGWLRFDRNEQLQELLKSITPTLEAYAMDERHLDMVREQSRKTIAEFVRDWLLTEKEWREDRFHTINVIFVNEKASPDNLSPVIQLKLD